MRSESAEENLILKFKVTFTKILHNERNLK